MAIINGESNQGFNATNVAKDPAIECNGSADYDPSCVIGMACRVPGSNSPSKLWENIKNKVDLRTKMPEDRFNVDTFYHPDGTQKGSTNAKYGYFLDQDLGLFDAGFFNISGKEAEAMDPQQRILLEVVYEALENANITLDEIRGSKTSVYCGCFTNDYQAMTNKDLETYPKYNVTGTGNSILANRISYVYDLHGPSVTVDTACSSSLVGLHMGNLSLQTGDADLAIVVGSALHFDPNIFITMTDLGMLSTDGRCRHGDANGSGYVRGEGITAVILKRQRAAEVGKDKIRAVVRATGVNHDGKKQGITLPSPEAQAALIRETYAKAGLDPLDTTYVECHGTGTKAGDPRELKALNAVFSEGREEPLHIGSIKTNIGHLEGASGLAGVIKSVMALENRKIPPNMHFSTPNPEIDFEGWKLKIPTSAVDWKAKGDIPLRVSVNSFGYGGTNAHAVLEEHASGSNRRNGSITPDQLACTPKERPYLAPITAHSDKAANFMAEKLSNYLETNPEVNIADFVTTLSHRRSMHSRRAFAVGHTSEALLNSLGEAQGGKWTRKMDQAPRLGFVFTGQGAQWFAMGRQLIEQSIFFRQTLERCDQILQGLNDKPDWTILNELSQTKETSRLAETTLSQPICTALQLALVDLLAQWNVRPSSVVGHSSGELAASYAAGITSFENSLVSAYYRGVHMGSSAMKADSTPGAMMAVGMTETEAIAEIAPYAGRITIAAMNSPTSFTLSGDEEPMEELREKLSERKVFCRRLQVAQAFHSHHMQPLAPGYEKALADHPGFEAKSGTARMFSSVTARVADPALMGPGYFSANMTGSVKFSDALTGTVLDEDEEQIVDVLVEIGPHPALKGPSKEIIESLKLKIPYFGTLDRKVPAYESLLASAGNLFAHGYPVDLIAVNSDQYIDEAGNVISSNMAQTLNDLPSYAWDHERYWAETRVIKDHRLRKFKHSILGTPVPGCLEERPRWRNYLRTSEIPWLADHSIDGNIIFPAAGYINMAIEAAARIGEPGAPIKQIQLKDISIKTALAVREEDEGTEIALDLRPVTESAKTVSRYMNEFSIFSFDNSGQPKEHCTGLVQVTFGEPDGIHRYTEYKTAKQLCAESTRHLSQGRFYQRLYAVGLHYGSTFRLLSGNVESSYGNATAPIQWQPQLFPGAETDICILHPALLDASLHPAFAAIEQCLGADIQEPYVPTFIRSMKVSGILDENKALQDGFKGHVSVDTAMNGPRNSVNDIRIESDQDGKLLLDIEGLELTSLGTKDEEANRSLFFATQWLPAFTFLEPDQVKNTSSIVRLLELYIHQFPGSKILHHSSSPSVTRQMLDLLCNTDGVRHKFQKFAVHSASSDNEEVYKEMFANHSGMPIELNPTESEKYDLVINTTNFEEVVIDSVEDDGYIISHSSVALSGPKKLWSTADLSVWHNTAVTVDPVTDLTLVMPTTPSPETEALAADIEALVPATCQRKVLADFAEQDPFQGNAIVLSSLDMNLFGGFINDSKEFRGTQQLLANNTCNLVWVTRGALMEAPCPEQATILGLARSARSESEDLRFVVFDLPAQSTNAQVPKTILSFVDKSVQENEIAERDGVLYIPRIGANDDLNAKIANGVKSNATLQPLYQPNRPLALRVGRPGLLESLYFADDLEVANQPIGPDDVDIEVKASAINFRDIAAGLGIIDDYKLGDECTGIVIKKGANVSDEAFKVGDRVVAIRPGQGAHKTIVRNPAIMCYKLGPMSFTTAASLPLILMTAHFALVDTARLQPGETVLIHSAAGGVGQMALQVAKNIGANVIATVGSQEKRDYLKNQYGLSDDQISSSRNESFVEDVHRITKGRGVDVVLNSLAGDLLHATWSCMASFGRFVEIGKRDIHQNSKIGMDPFRRNVTFASVDLITMWERNQKVAARVFNECCALVDKGKILPPAITELSYAEAHEGFRLLQRGSVIGKIVLVPGPEDKVLVEPSKFGKAALFDAKKTYLLVGGLGGLGRSLSEWLYRRGARKLAFLSRSGAEKSDAKDTVDWLKDRNVDVSVFQGDVADAGAVTDCIEQIGTSLAGVFHAAMVLQDKPLDKLTYSQWKKCCDPKVKGAQNLHRATVNKTLDFFICFSSVSGIIGGKAQTNYSAANNYLDALCSHRRQQGLPAVAIDVGMVVGIGAVSQNAKLQRAMERVGIDAVQETELFSHIESAITCDQVAIKDRHGFDAHQIITGVNLRRKDYYWATEPRFRVLYSNNDFQGEDASSGQKKSLTAQLALAKTEEEKIAVLTEGFLDKISAVMSVERDSIEPSRSLADYGLDSIVAVELRQWIFKNIAVELALFDILSSSSITALIAKVAVSAAQSASKGNGDSGIDNGDNSESSGQKSASKSRDASFDALVKSESGMAVPMSTFQTRLWFTHNFAEDKSLLNLSIVAKVRGNPNVNLVRQALEEVKKNNDILRTAYTEGEEFSEQEVLDDYTIDLPHLDFSNSDDPESMLKKHLEHEGRIPLDIEMGENMKVSMAKLSEDDHALAFVFHHIALDRGSGNSFCEQFVSIYDCLRESSNLDAVKPPQVSYAEFTLWHNAHLKSPEIQERIEFWKSVFEKKTKPMDLLPFAQVDRPEQNDYKRSVIHDVFGKAMHNRMKRICSRLQMTPAQFILAAFRTFLYRYTEEEDITIHMIDGNRPHPAVRDTIGFFVNMVPVRCNTAMPNDFETALQQMKGVVLEALEHSEVPFDTIVDAVDAERSFSFFPLGQVAVNYQMHGTTPVYSAGDFEIYETYGEDVPSGCELSLEAMEDPALGLKLRLEYSSTIYAESDMDRFFENFNTFLTSAVQDHRQPIFEINMTGPKELAHLKNNFFNMDFTDNTWNDQTVVDRILEVAKKQPEAIAIETSDNEVLTYENLVSKAADIRHAITSSGTESGNIIAILSKPGIPAISAMVGVLLSGCGYVALDPSFATERLAFMVSDSGAKLILAGDSLDEVATDISRSNELQVHTIENIPKSSRKIDTSVSGNHDDPFFMVYTSGSTGTPKGVVLSQSNTQSMLSILNRDYAFSKNDRFFHQSSICFDLSIVQIFSALTCGGRVCVALPSVRQDPVALAGFMESSKASVTYFTPTQFALLVEHAKNHLQNLDDYRVAFFAGERLPVRLAKAFYDLATPATMYNTWSPSELVVQTTIQKVEYPEDHIMSIPIGFPMANTRHYILDSQCQPLPPGLVGEIVVGGAQVGKGYLNRPDANKKSFVLDPFRSEEDGARGWNRMFRTGDKGRFRPDGSLEFHGRISGDKQVKLRGFRIDLGEVEHRIFSEANAVEDGPGLVDISVIARETQADTESLEDTRQIVAFVVPKKPLNVSEKPKVAYEMHSGAAKHLNAYMLPNGYQFLESLPLTIGGKVNRQALLNCELNLTFPSMASTSTPSNNTVVTSEEAKDDGNLVDLVKGLFREILSLPEDFEIDADESFFKIGGQSVLMLRLQAKLKRTIQKSVPLSEMFKTPSAAGIADVISRTLAKPTPGRKRATGPKDRFVDWNEETTLKEENVSWKPLNGSKPVSRSEVREVLITGVDSFIGIHVLARLLLATNCNIHVVCSSKALGYDDLTKVFEKYSLLNSDLTIEILRGRVIPLSGTLGSPKFGLSQPQFEELGKTVQSIYHLGGGISLAQSYDDVKASNIPPIYDIIELAAMGDNPSEIHYLSTWSVPHLQTWTTSKRTVRNETVIGEQSADHFTPERSGRMGYFKTRWVAEMLFEQAAAQGHHVSIYRASAATAHSKTGVSEPKDDFIRAMIMTMIDIGAIPKLRPSDRGFVVDFIPVDYLAAGLQSLASNDTVKANEKQSGAQIFHLCNPSPLPLAELPLLMQSIGGDSLENGRVLSMDDWFETASRADSELDSSLRLSILKDYLKLGHNMFALDATKTLKTLRAIGVQDCKPVGRDYLLQMSKAV